MGCSEGEMKRLSGRRGHGLRREVFQTSLLGGEIGYFDLISFHSPANIFFSWRVTVWGGG